VIEGIIYGLISGLLSFAVIMPIIYFLAPYAKTFIPEINLWNYLISNSIKLVGYQTLSGVVLGIFSSSVAIRKYLRI